MELPGVAITKENIQSFLDSADVSTLTRERYGHSLRQFYRWLPEDKTLSTGILEKWRAELFERGYAQRTAFAQISACNSFVGYLGRRDLQIALGDVIKTEQPEITREEYMRMLVAARSMGDELDYIFIKLIAVTGIPMHKLEKLTLEQFEEMKTPDLLRQEVREYARRNGIVSGYLFRSRSGRPYDRKLINLRIKKIGAMAHVPEDRATPRCLQRLYRQTMDEIRGDIDMMVSISYNRMLEREQSVVAWQK